MRHLILISLVTLLTACAGSGGSGGAAGTPGYAGRSLNMTLNHGVGFTCWLESGGLNVWCWADSQATLNSGEAALVGLISVVPVIVVSAPANNPITTLQILDHAICYVDDQRAQTFCPALGPAIGNSHYVQTVPCETTAADSVNCPSEPTRDLTFTGVAL